MPKQNIESHCIICGRPSGTKVCMHCFFNYDYRTYNSQELEKRRVMEEELNPWHLNLDAISEDDPLPETEHPFSDDEEHGEDDTSGHGFGLSWLPKFPRFS